MVIHHHTLRELRHVHPAQERLQIRLSGQDDLKLQCLVLIEIGEQPQFLQQVCAEILRLIHDQHHPPPACRLLGEERSEQVLGLDRIEPESATSGKLLLTRPTGVPLTIVFELSPLQPPRIQLAERDDD